MLDRMSRVVSLLKWSKVGCIDISIGENLTVSIFKLKYSGYLAEMIDGTNSLFAHWKYFHLSY